MPANPPFRTHSTPATARSPLVGVAFSALAGCALAAALPGIPPLQLVGGSCIALAFVLFGPQRSRTPFLWIALTLGWFAFALPAFSPSHPQSLAQQLSRNSEFVQAQGWVRADPVQLRARDGAPGRWRIAVELTAWKRLPTAQPVHGQITVWTDAPNSQHLRVGDRIEAQGPLTLRDGPGAGLHRSQASMDVQADQLTLLKGTGGPAWMRLADRLRRACANRLSAGLGDHPEALAVWLALLLGYRHDVPEPLEALFSDTGTFHLFAISGLHAGIVGVVLIAIARVFRIPQPRWVWLMLPGLLLFAACTGFRASTVRAVIMAVAWFAAPAFQRRPHGLSAWALSALIILAVAPTQITDLGFQFSFGIVLGLMLLYRPLTERWTQRLQRDPWALDEETLWRTALRAIGRHLISLAGLSLCAWIVSAPLMATHFERLAPGGLLANLLVVPLAFVTVTAGMLSLLTGWLIPWLGDTFNYAGLATVDLMLACVRGVARIPGATAGLTAPPVLLAACWYGWFAVAGWRRKASAFTFALLAAIVLTMGLIETERHSRVRIELINTGGTATTLVRHHRKVLLIDPGPARAWPRLERELQRRAITRIDTLVLTHGLAASTGSAPQLMQTLSVGALWVAPTEKPTASLSTARAIAQQNGISLHEKLRGDHGRWHGSLYVETLAPGPRPVGQRTGDRSLILRLSSGTHTLLIEGGATPALESDTLAAGIDPHAARWLVTTSDDYAAASTPWVRAIWPRTIYVPRDTAASFFGPRRTLLTRLGQSNATVVHLGDEAETSWEWPRPQ